MMNWLRKRPVAIGISAVISLISLFVMLVINEEEEPVYEAWPIISTTEGPAEARSATPPPMHSIPVSEGDLTFGSTFEFSNLLITFGDRVGWTAVDVEWSNLYGQTVFYVPVTVTNLYTSTQRLPSYRIRKFGPDGLRVEDVGYLFDDDVSHWNSEMRPGATLHSYMHILYNGSGQYVLEFDPAWWDDTGPIEVFFDVSG